MSRSMMSKVYSQNDMYDFCNEDKMIIKSLKVPVPADEFTRIKVLRQTELLDSTQSDPEFDRYTSMARRIFQVPIALISLVDLDRQWFKSKFGLDADQTHRDLAFCSYTVLPQSPDVFVVTNALNDVRFRDTALVTGYPHIRFYAGAALIVNGVKLGSLCVIDTVARENFSLDDKMTLMDIGQAVATLIRERRESVLNLQQDREMMVMNIVHNIRTPLMSAQMSCAMLNEDRVSLIRILKTSNNTNATKLIANLVSSLDDLDTSLKKVKEATDTSVGVAEIVLNKHLQCGINSDASNVATNGHNSNSDNLESVTQLDRFSLNEIMSELAKAFTESANMRTNKCDTSWLFSQPFAKKLFLSNLKNIKYSIITTMNTLSNDFANLAVHFDFISSHASECNLKDMTTEQSEGHFMIKVKVTSPKGSSGKNNHYHDSNSIFGTNNNITPSASTESIGISNNNNNNNRDSGVYVASDFCPTPLSSSPSATSLSFKQKLDAASNNSTTNNDVDFPLVFSKTFLSITNNIEKIERSLIHADGQFKFRIMKDDFSVLEFVAKFPCATEDVHPSLSSSSSKLSPRSESGHNNNNGSKLNSSFRSSGNNNANHRNTNNSNHISRAVNHSNNNNNSSNSDNNSEYFLSSPLSSPIRQSNFKNDTNMQQNSSTNSLNNSLSNRSTASTGNFHSSAKGCNDYNSNTTDNSTSQPLSSLVEYTETKDDDHYFYHSPVEKIRVVVVEDSVPIQRVMKRILESKGCIVEIAANGKLGLECFLMKQYDLAFVDFLMPVLSGLGLMQEYSDYRQSGVSAIKTATSVSGKKAFNNNGSGDNNQDINENMMIWGMSATASVADQDLGKQLGMHLFTQKPLDNRLVDIMLSILNTVKQQQSIHEHELRMQEVDQILDHNNNNNNISNKNSSNSYSSKQNRSSSKESKHIESHKNSSTTLVSTVGGNVKDWVNLFEQEKKKQQAAAESKQNDNDEKIITTLNLSSVKNNNHHQ